MTMSEEDCTKIADKFPDQLAERGWGGDWRGNRL